jgi:hypothetical protein
MTLNLRFPLGGRLRDHDVRASGPSKQGKDDPQPRQQAALVERTVVSKAPFTKCDWEADYERAWRGLESRSGGAMG